MLGPEDGEGLRDRLVERGPERLDPRQVGLDPLPVVAGVDAVLLERRRVDVGAPGAGHAGGVGGEVLRAGVAGRVLEPVLVHVGHQLVLPLGAARDQVVGVVGGPVEAGLLGVEEADLDGARRPRAVVGVPLEERAQLGHPHRDARRVVVGGAVVLVERGRGVGMRREQHPLTGAGRAGDRDLGHVRLERRLRARRAEQAAGLEVVVGRRRVGAQRAERLGVGHRLLPVRVELLPAVQLRRLVGRVGRVARVAVLARHAVLVVGAHVVELPVEEVDVDRRSRAVRGGRVRRDAGGAEQRRSAGQPQRDPPAPPA